MSKSKKSFDTHKLLQEFTKTVEICGLEETSQVLTKHRESKKSALFINNVIEMVCRKYNMTESSIIDVKGRNNVKRVYGLKFIIFYCYQGINISMKELGARVKRKPSIICEYVEEMQNRKKDRSDSLQKYFSEFDAEVKKFSKQNNANVLTTKANKQEKKN